MDRNSKKSIKLIVTSTILISTINVTNARTIASFDTETLKQYGISPAIAAQLAKEPVFLPGTHNVKVFINNTYINKFNLTFDENSELCLNAKKLQELGLKKPNFLSSKSTCVHIEKIWNNAKTIKKPNALEVWLIVPESAINFDAINLSEYKYGGTAALANYTINYLGSSGDKNKTKDMYLVRTEAGFNVGNWTFRSSQSYNHIQKSEYIHHNAYAQTTLEKYEKNLQIGQINLDNLAVGSPRVIGFQVFPDYRLQGYSVGDAVVSGIATESSVVEIYQSGRLLYSTAVAAGAFELTQFQLVNRTSDLQVYLKGINGANQEFIVPASTFLYNTPSPESGVSFGVGRYDEDSSAYKPLVISLSKGWKLSPYVGMDTGWVGTDRYNVFGVNINSSLNAKTAMQISNSFSFDKRNARQGNLLSASLQYRWTPNFTTSITGLNQTKNYSYIQSSLSKYSYLENEYDSKQKQVSFGASWQTDGFGSFNSSVGRAYMANNKTNDFFTISWAQNFYRNYSFSITAQRTFTTNNKIENSLYFRINIPLDRSSVSTWLNRNNNLNRIGASYTNHQNDLVNWGVSYEHAEMPGNYKNYEATTITASTTTPYTSLTGSISQDNNQLTSYSALVSGGLLLADEGLLFSPHTIQDTFGVAKAGSSRFTKVNSNSGVTWTNGKGYAVIPSLQAYSNNAITLDTLSLSKQTDVANAYLSVKPARASVVPIEFSLREVRRVLVKVTADGKLIPENSLVTDSSNNFLTIASKPGQIFLDNATNKMQLQIQLNDQQSCKLVLSLPETAPKNAIYEQADAVCTLTDE